jgi:hypothetical protein
MGLNYGYAPWEKKNDVVMVAQEPSEGSDSAPPADRQGKTVAAGQAKRPARNHEEPSQSQANLAAAWSPRHEHEPFKPKSHLKPPPSRHNVTADDDRGIGLIQPRTMAPRGKAAPVEFATAGDDAASPPEQSASDLPNVDDLSDNQPTPDE